MASVLSDLWSIPSLIVSDEGEYVCPRCTVFGLEKEEVQSMIEQGYKFTDHNKEEEGYEVNSSIFKVTNLNYLFKTSQAVKAFI